MCCRGVQGGSIVDGISFFKKNIASHFEGQAECAICYSWVMCALFSLHGCLYVRCRMISAMDGSLAKKPCKTCRNRFHAGCLYKVRLGFLEFEEVAHVLYLVVRFQPFVELPLVPFGDPALVFQSDNCIHKSRQEPMNCINHYRTLHRMELTRTCISIPAILGPARRAWQTFHFCCASFYRSSLLVPRRLPSLYAAAICGGWHPWQAGSWIHPSVVCAAPPWRFRSFLRWRSPFCPVPRGLTVCVLGAAPRAAVHFLSCCAQDCGNRV